MMRHGLIPTAMTITDAADPRGSRSRRCLEITHCRLQPSWLPLSCYLSRSAFYYVATLTVTAPPKIHHRFLDDNDLIRILIRFAIW